MCWYTAVSCVMPIARVCLLLQSCWKDKLQQNTSMHTNASCTHVVVHASSLLTSSRAHIHVSHADTGHASIYDAQARKAAKCYHHS